MGEAYAAAGQYAESVKYLRRAIAIVETYEIESNCDVRYPAAPAFGYAFAWSSLAIP